MPDYREFDARFGFLFNSYYVAAGPRHARPERGLITRPTVEEVAAYRAHVDAAVARLLQGADAATLKKIVPIVEIGLHHEQQHQELMLTDILHAFAQNPTDPVYDPAWRMPAFERGDDYVRIPAGIRSIGFDERRLLLRQRAAGASGAAAGGGDRAPSRQQRRVAEVHGRWRLHRARPLAVRWLGQGRGRAMAGAGLLAQRRRRGGSR